jgi:S1-C subfamily serine protease
MRVRVFFLFFSLATAGGLFPAYAAPYFTGTGFFVSRNGQVVTNAHVVERCADVHIRTTDGALHAAEIAERDAGRDLALLETRLLPERPARLRHRYTGVQKQERVVVMGYPGEASRDGRYRVAYSSVRALQGAQGEKHWLQFEDSVQMGNSGGPLLDYAGNVVGVVTGKATTTRYNAMAAREELVGQSDFAVNLETLRGFLDGQRVLYESRDSLMKLSPAQVEAAGREFVVNVLCRQPE